MIEHVISFIMLLKVKISQEGPIQAQFKQQEESTLRPNLYSDFQQKRSSKSPAKFSERTGPGYPEAARRPGSSGNAGQLL